MTVRFQRAAKADLVDAWIHIAEDSVDRADDYIAHIQQVCTLIAENPEMGIERPDLGDGIRSFPVDRHVIYYEVERGVMAVLRVWHSARDPQSLMLEP